MELRTEGTGRPARRKRGMGSEDNRDAAERPCKRKGGAPERLNRGERVAGADPDWVVGTDGKVAYWVFEGKTGGADVRMALATVGMLPGGVGNECPISREPFDEPGVVSAVGDRPFCEAEPDLCVGVLPCGHIFSAVTITYHMAMNNMVCPVCRWGPKRKMKARSIPSHFRKAIVDSARNAAEQERREMDQVGVGVVGLAVSCCLVCGCASLPTQCNPRAGVGRGGP